MLKNLFSIRQFRLTKWSFLVHSTTLNAPYINLSHDSILELWQTFPNVLKLSQYVLQCLYSNTIHTNFIIEANNMNPGQNALKMAV